MPALSGINCVTLGGVTVSSLRKEGDHGDLRVVVRINLHIRRKLSRMGNGYDRHSINMFSENLKPLSHYVLLVFNVLFYPGQKDHFKFP